jgi:enterochelin esterase-like enzyme
MKKNKFREKATEFIRFFAKLSIMKAKVSLGLLPSLILTGCQMTKASVTSQASLSEASPSPVSLASASENSVSESASPSASESTSSSPSSLIDADSGDYLISDTLYDTYHADRVYGAVSYIEYPSEYCQGIKHASVILPVGYDEKQQYPVVYLMPGLSDNSIHWVSTCRAPAILENLVYEGMSKKVIAVSVNSFMNDNESDDGFRTAQTFDESVGDVINSLMPYINNHYGTLADRDHTAICGLSMGGREALRAAFLYPDVFGYVGAFEPWLVDQSDIPSNVTYHLVLLEKGNQDKVVRDAPLTIAGMLTEANIPYLYYTVDYQHEQAAWSNGLYNFARRIFRS